MVYKYASRRPKCCYDLADARELRVGSVGSLTRRYIYEKHHNFGAVIIRKLHGTIYVGLLHRNRDTFFRYGFHTFFLCMNIRKMYDPDHTNIFFFQHIYTKYAVSLCMLYMLSVASGPELRAIISNILPRLSDMRTCSAHSLTHSKRTLRVGGCLCVRWSLRASERHCGEKR